jgi:hypothetical protein
MEQLSLDVRFSVGCSLSAPEPTGRGTRCGDGGSRRGRAAGVKVRVSAGPALPLPVRRVPSGRRVITCGSARHEAFVRATCHQLEPSLTIR